VTTVPCGYDASQVPDASEQLIPRGELVTVPWAPLTATSSATSGKANVTPHVWAWDIVTVAVVFDPAAAQSPDHVNT
jgi:hypothetical protein